jgi:hypothetical protein
MAMVQMDLWRSLNKKLLGTGTSTIFQHSKGQKREAGNFSLEIITVDWMP